MDPHFDGVIFQTHAAELERRLRQPFPPYCVLDVRPVEEFAAGHLPGAMTLSADDLSDGLPEGTGPGTEFFILGETIGDARVRPVSMALMRQGAQRVVEFGGGFSEWKAFGFPVDATDA